MPNLEDYIKWRGDLSFKVSPFNEIDNMILARFSYMPFRRIKMDKSETIENIAKKMKKFEEDKFSFHGDREMCQLMGHSTRFKDLIVTDFEENNDKESEKQFAAITIHLPERIIYLSFNGTDNSIVGWKEDFNMSFMENVPSQIEGKEYTKKIAEKYPYTKIMMGGHSKGGNIAVYSAIACGKRIQNRIKKVINCDGPGFDKNIVESENYKNIIDKVYTYIPQDSVIGRILEHEEKYDIVLSTAKGIYQHDIHSWQVEGTKVITVDKLTESSDTINQTLRAYLKNTTPDQRKMFVGIVYDLIESTNVSTFKEFSKVWVQKLPTLFKAYKNINDEDKKMMTQMVVEFFKTGNQVFKENKEKEIKKIKR